MFNVFSLNTGSILESYTNVINQPSRIEKKLRAEKSEGKALKEQIVFMANKKGFAFIELIAARSAVFY